MTLKTLKTRLRSGWSLRRLGAKKIGRGGFRTAYRIGEWVVKRAHPHTHGEMYGAWRLSTRVARQQLAGSGIRLAPTHRVGPWEIQRYYPKLPMARAYQVADTFGQSRPHGHDLDIGYPNLGENPQGQPVLFDW